ncbi:polyketide cyclase / dehydrase and lipid transport family protein [Neorickettsia helminthoeca str. Oregon]|uniref:Polyketide cyclase / dehydrase and lipid transport family protein n=1 Tax=Neorickettsia helminthoeca str. Oregon TaxID=1286528 RepID=X5H3J4_9RICK|nr:type II toxin-antitoxin system RatA family toxin [Neorickettsia helminthoeca]AHX11268.1 polyketide cyclase / dehydrase and lipid transport family protein [Neorickettsia helminthoeca str. Oregon]
MMFKKSSYRDERVLPFSAMHVFEIVLDIECYHEFIPWCQKIRVISKAENEIKAEVVASFKGIVATYVSLIKFLPPGNEEAGFIEVKSTEGAFKYLYNLWKFHPEGKGSRVTFYIEYSFRSKFMQLILNMMYNIAQRRIISAFENRCGSLPDNG